MDKIKYRQRLKALFADLEHLAAHPGGQNPAIRSELEALRVRLLALEAEFLESEKHLTTPAEQPVMPEKGAGHSLVPEILYDRDQVGFVYSGDRLESLQDAPSAIPDMDQPLTALLTARPEACASFADWRAIFSVWLAFSAVCLMLAAISSIEAEASSAAAACSVAPWLSVSALDDNC